MTLVAIRRGPRTGHSSKSSLREAPRLGRLGVGGGGYTPPPQLHGAPRSPAATLVAGHAYALRDRRLGGGSHVHATLKRGSCMTTPRKRVEVGHQQMRTIVHGDPPTLVLGNTRRCKLRTRRCKMRYARRCKLRPEAMQIEAQALVSDRVNQDPSDTHLPATAWPRQTFAAAQVTQCPLLALAHRRVAVIAARPQRAKPLAGTRGQEYGRFYA